MVEEEGTKEGSGTTRSVEDLPDECLSLILQSLPQESSPRDSSSRSCSSDRDAASLACQRWRKIDRLLRTGLRFTPHCQPYHLLRQCPQVSRISFSSPGLPLFRTDNPNLGFAVAFTRAYPLDTTIATIASSCLYLEAMDLSSCMHVTDCGIEAVVDACPRLTSLTITKCIRISGWGLRHGRSLKTVRVRECKLSDAGLQEGLRGATRLQVLDLGDCRYDGSIAGLGPATLASIGQTCTMLEALSLRKCRVLNDAALESIVRGCCNLRELNLACCSGVMAHGWRALVESCNKLEILHVDRCFTFTNDSLLALQSRCPRLQQLRLSRHSTAISDAAVEVFQVARPNVAIVPDEMKELILASEH